MYPVLFEFGPIVVHSLWFFISLGFIAGSFMLTKIAKRNRLKMDFLLKNGIPLMLCSLVSARLVFIIFHFASFVSPAKPWYTALLAFFKIWDKGLSFWGGLLGFFIVFKILTEKNGEPLKKWLDAIAIAILTSMIFASIGMFLDGIAHGKETVLPWGMVFQSAVVKYAVPIHPTQAYAFFALLGILIFAKRKSSRLMNSREGKTFELAVLLVSLYRFLEEFLRGDDAVMIFGIIRLPQIIAFGIFLFMAYRLDLFNRILHSISEAKKSLAPRR